MTVTLEIAKAHLRILHDDEDNELVGPIQAAHSWITRYCGDGYEDSPVLDIAELMLIAMFYEDREGTQASLTNGVPRGIAHLVVPFRRGSYA
jgi:uncharacterized phage protein (predicted DNA packaging)